MPTATAAFSQGVGGQAVYAEVNGVLEVVTTENGAEVVTFSDSGGWLALSAHTVVPVSAMATFAQVSTWDAEAAESIPSIATWSQTAEWEAGVAQSLDAAADFSQDATWAAEGAVADVEITSSAEWSQGATWAGLAATATPFVPSAGFYPQQPFIYDDAPAPIAGAASFAQVPAKWRADMDVNDDEPLLLSDLLELVA